MHCVIARRLNNGQTKRDIGEIFWQKLSARYTHRRINRYVNRDRTSPHLGINALKYDQETRIGSKEDGVREIILRVNGSFPIKFDWGGKCGDEQTGGLTIIIGELCPYSTPIKKMKFRGGGVMSRNNAKKLMN